jgi:hypothetical protein
MSARTAKQSRETAYHEAGHAVARCRLRLPIKKVSIEENEDYQGIVLPGPLADSIDPESGNDLRTRDRLEKEIITCYAGIAAERRVNRRTPGWHAEADMELAVDWALYQHGGGPVVDAYLRYLRIRTDDYITSPLWWPAIEAVASALLDRQTLSGRDVRAVLRANDKGQIRAANPHLAAEG